MGPRFRGDDRKTFATPPPFTNPAARAKHAP